MDLYTKNGKPLQVTGDNVYSRSGAVVGRIKNGKIFGTDGRYVGTIEGDRLVYRSTDSAVISSPFVTARRAGIGRANRAGSAIWGDEPNIPE
jgi:hypothetical protein